VAQPQAGDVAEIDPEVDELAVEGEHVRRRPRGRAGTHRDLVTAGLRPVEREEDPDVEDTSWLP
jgi:hypothetical protein